MLLEIIREAKSELAISKNGHLHLVKRVQIAKELKAPEKVNKVFLACCKFVYYQLNINDILLSSILEKAENSLYKAQNIDFRDLYNQNKNYIEGLNGRPHSDVALACLSLCSNLSNGASNLLDIEDYEGEDDNFYDWESWTPDFFSANAFAGGNPFLHEGSKERRTEFWNFFLDTVIQVFENPNTPIGDEIKTQENNLGNIVRTKNYKDEFIQEKLDKVIELIIQDLKAANVGSTWTKIEIEGQDIGGMGMTGYYFNEQNEKKRFELTYYLYSGEQSTVKLMHEVKKHIYEQSPQEGTWYAYKLTIEPSLVFEAAYNFDDPKIYSDKEPVFEPFVEEFKSYPRTAEFTPGWWQDIITKNKLEYLK